MINVVTRKLGFGYKYSEIKSNLPDDNAYVKPSWLEI